MKKTLIALAALAATGAFAQSTVTIDGTLDAGYRQTNSKGTNSSDVIHNNSATSGLNFRGTEDIGGGLKANFRVESNWNPVANNALTNAGGAQSTFANGEIRVGLSGGFGSFDIGRVNLATLGILGQGTPFGVTNVGNGYGAVGSSFISVSDSASNSGNTVTSSDNVRRNNSMMYTSPVMGGFKVSLYNVNKVESGTDTLAHHKGLQEIAATYSQGALNLGLGQVQDNGINGNLNTTITTIAGNYALGNGFTVYALNQRVLRSDNTLDRTSTMISGKYVTGAHSMALGLGNGKDGGSAANGKTTNLISLGYDYALSKRTAAYARYENFNDDGRIISNADGAGGDVKRTITAVGLRHTF